MHSTSASVLNWRFDHRSNDVRPLLAALPHNERVAKHAFLGVCVGGVLLLGASHAEARELPRVLPGDVWLPFGVVSSISTFPGGRDYLGIGGEVSVVEFGGDEWLGAFVQLQALGWLNDLDLDREWHPRFAAGFEGGWRFFGIESGFAVKGAFPDGSQRYATTLLLHTAPVLTMGMASLTMPIGIPLATLSDGLRIPLEIGGTFAVKIPVRISR